jgi:site-specific DNA-methyltransferase (adenine-specific)
MLTAAAIVVPPGRFAAPSPCHACGGAEGMCVCGRLHLGDCLEVLRGLPDGCVDAVVTDPPYNVGIDYGVTTDDGRADYESWCRRWFAEVRRVCRGAVAVSVGQSNLSMWATLAAPDWWLAWWKPAAMGRCAAGFNNWEPIALYGRPYRAGCDVIRAEILPDDSVAGHPCPKPLQWGRALVRMLCPPGGTVLDPFMGSGTTGVAAVMEGRKFVGVEISPEYFAIAQKRICEAEACRDGRGVGELFQWRWE